MRPPGRGTDAYDFVFGDRHATALWAGPTNALSVSIDFAGSGFSFQTLGGIVLPAEISGLSSFSGNMVIDDQVTDSNGSTTSGWFLGAVFSFDAILDTGFSVSASNAILYQSRFTALSAWTASTSSISTDLVSQPILAGIDFQLGDGDAGGQDLFTDPNVLFASLPEVSELDDLKRLELVFQDGLGGGAYVRGNLTLIPEPSAILLLGAGLAVVTRGRTRSWSRRNRQSVLIDYESVFAVVELA